MPRDLRAMAEDAKTATVDSLPSLTKSPEEVESDGQAPSSDFAATESHPDGPLGAELAQRQHNDRLDGLHPYTQTLKISDIDSCVALEEATFPPNERCDRPKFSYRLKACGEISLGIFTSATDSSTPTAATSAPVYSGAPARKAVLLGHIVATKTTNAVVTDADMDYPSPSDPSPDLTLGHKEAGRTLCIHSLAVLPAYQRRGLGTTLMKAYLQRMESHGVADRAALIAHEGLIGFYQGLGFENRGRSEATFGGGGWWDMVCELGTGKVG